MQVGEVPTQNNCLRRSTLQQADHQHASWRGANPEQLPPQVHPAASRSTQWNHKNWKYMQVGEVPTLNYCLHRSALQQADHQHVSWPGTNPEQLPPQVHPAASRSKQNKQSCAVQRGDMPDLETVQECQSCAMQRV